MVYKGKHIFDYWKHFPNLEVLISLDGVKKQGEYIRKGLNYNELKQNVYSLRDSGLPFTKIGFMVTYGVLNYEHLFDIVLEFLKEDLTDKDFPKHGRYNIREILFSPIFRPENLDCSYLPSTFKERFFKRLQTFDLELDKVGTSEKVKQDLIDKLKSVYAHSTQNQYNRTIMESFVKDTVRLDAVRKEKFNDVFDGIDLFNDYTNDSLTY